MSDENPFPLTGYSGPELFCDREEETARLISYIRNGVNTVLISTRRMGKTGLLQHVFHALQNKKDVECIYVDIYGTQDLEGFTNALSTAVMRAIPEQKSLGKKFMDFLKGFKPQLSFDSVTGEPEVSIHYASAGEVQRSLTSLLKFLDAQKKIIVVAIDEFQQIINYPEKNTEAILRTVIQHLRYVRFIYSGSSEHILTEMFHNVKRPFYLSSQLMQLKEIDAGVYSKFIEKKFSAAKRKITKEAANEIVEWTRAHTYYTQALSNRVFSSGNKNITPENVRKEAHDLLLSQESIFYQYRNLLTPIQWQFLRALAKEDKVYKPTAKDFMKKHNVGTQANVQRSVDALMTKDMIYRSRDEKGNFYRVSDCFLARWFEKH